jgi:hypothetical protein
MKFICIKLKAIAESMRSIELKVKEKNFSAESLNFTLN